MSIGKDDHIGQFKLYIGIVGVVVVLVVVFGIVTGTFRMQEEGVIPQAYWLLISLVLLTSIVGILLTAFKILEKLAQSSNNFEKIVEILEKNTTEIEQISKNTHLSETAKMIASREADKQSLREALIDKLQQQDFKEAYEIVDEIANSTIYRELAGQLRAEADRYRSASDHERANQIILHIEKLLDSHQWARASARIERLTRMYPGLERAKEMPQRLIDRKAERKKILLNAWDDAVKRQDTDRSLEILKDLDSYLTPNEGLALQEAARDVFRNKLHNLGVQFSLAVSERQWAQALDAGRVIINDFPNSKMAKEIRERMDVLSQKARQRK